ncbi:histidine phosphatase family protein [Sinomonas sp. ASV486]|uniref:histidine phosphatase family protein n=1 Tax=Sinomonas sp. ASV486 TaxID=3051170 RepID=UPI0027DDD10D|nr:histidine phosphatase family protein [Sinomonas sp. ASV486]MDQ4492331.1 histidine phosphatase family protein [Sinomonas sp. ASV486]
MTTDSAGAGYSRVTGRRIVFWRHGRTDWNAAGRFQGQIDVPLNEEGRQQAAEAALRLASLSPDAIVCSDLARARTTADALASVTGLPAKVDAGLRETNAGNWQGHTFDAIRTMDPDALHLWEDGDVHTAAGGAETRLDVASRVHQAVDRALGDVAADGTLVVVSHGGAIRVGLAHLLGLPHDLWGALSGLSNCSWSILEERRPHNDGSLRWRLGEHNAGTLPVPVTLEEG